MTRARWRLYADGHIEKNTIDNLRKSGFDVLWIKEDKNIESRDDEFHYHNARKLYRYLLTKDMEFWDNRKYPLRNAPCMIILPNKNPKNDVDILVTFRSLSFNLLSPQEPIRDTQIKFNFLIQILLINGSMETQVKKKRKVLLGRIF